VQGHTVAAPRGALEDPRGEDQVGGVLVGSGADAKLGIKIPTPRIKGSWGVELDLFE
jgi:hypothetical protein